MPSREILEAFGSAEYLTNLAFGIATLIATLSDTEEILAVLGAAAALTLPA